MEEEIHLTEEIGQRLGLDAEEGVTLEAAVILGSLALFLEVLEGFDEKAAGAAGGIEHGFPEARVDHSDDEFHQRARSVELAGVARRIAHLL